MEFRLLGPLEVHRKGTVVPLSGLRERALLAALLLRANEIVSVGYLVESVWDRPPASPESNLRTYVASLRRKLAPLPDGSSRLITRTGGYQLVVGPGELDVAAFDELRCGAETALRDGDLTVAVNQFERALHLWHGVTPLAGLQPGPPLRAELARLTERRLATMELYMQARIDLGQHHAVVNELQFLVARHPLREELWALLMVALSRSGQRAEALDAYTRARTRLVEDLGIEPGTRLREVHDAVLSNDPALTVGPIPAFGPLRVASPPAQLPADVPDFVGRAEVLDLVVSMLSERPHEDPPPVVVLFGGPGVGKSTLAVHATRMVSAGFPDGQLYLDLAGMSDEPRDPAAMLADVLRSLGVTGAGVPDGPQARATLLRTLLAGRRILVVLDDAAHADQVRPLMPPDGGSAVVITSRRPLAELAGAAHVELDVLSDREAHLLFARIVGPDRVATEPEQAAAILDACGYLPLAIRIAAGKLVGRPAWTLRVLSERLADESRRLSELRLGDLGVRASFQLSLRLLPDEGVRAFQLLGLLGPHVLPGWVVGPLLDRPGVAEDVLDELVDTGLVRSTGTDGTGQPRYRLHDLLRAYALEAAQTLPVTERRAALTRLLAAWLDLAGRAAQRLPVNFHQPPQGGAPRQPLPDDLVSRLVADPVRWFDAESAALLGAIKLAADWGMDELAWELTATAAPYYDLRSGYEDWERGHRLALGAVRAAANLRGEAVLLRGLAQIQIYRDCFDDATANMARAVELFGKTGDKREQGLATAGLGVIHRVLGRYDRALDHARQALDTVIAAGDPHSEAHIRNQIGAIHVAQGRDDEARAWFEQALELSRRLGDTHREAAVLREVSHLYDRHGEPERAARCLRRALDIFTALDDQRCVGYTLLRAAAPFHARHGDIPRARSDLETAADIFARNGSRREEAKCWQTLGELAAAHGDVPDARRHLTHALTLWHSVGATDDAETTSATLRELG